MFENLSERLEKSFKILKGQGKITEINVAETLKEVRRSLLDADVNYKIAKEFTNTVKEKALGMNVLTAVKPGQMMVKIVHDELIQLMGGTHVDINIKGNPAVILMSGLQGSGKTTFSGKLANLLKTKRGKHPLLVACDVYRPAAIEQLKVLGEQIGVPVYSEEGNNDPVKIALNAVKEARATGKDVVIVDTAGRLAIDEQMMRWCCSMFKTGPITRIISSMYRSQQILTFYGIRKSESVSRSKYNRIEDDAESVKIQQQTVASPIFFWKDIDIWLYMLAEEVDFNAAYRLGYDRVGCWCCPNNNQRAQFLSRIYMPEESKKWREFLIDFAKKIGKPDPEVYVDSGKWKARQGGNGLPSAGDVKIRFTNCTTEDHAKIYRLVRPFDDELVGMFVPFGRVAPELGKKLLRETIILDVKTNVPILSIQPFNQDGYDYAVKVRTMNVADHDDLQRMVGYQIRKFNACRKCLKCESICRQGAISIIGDSYYVDPKKCIHCKMCMTAKYLDGGCMMDKYLRTK